MISNTLPEKKRSEINGPRKRSRDDATINIDNKELIVLEKNYSSVLYHCKLCNKVAANDAR